MKKNFLKIIGIIVIFIGLGGFWGYNKYFKPDPVIQQQLNNQFGTDFFTSFDTNKDVKNAGAINDTKQPNNDEESNSDHESNDEVSSDLTVQNGNPKMTTATPVNETIAAKQITENEITLKYKPYFSYLQSVALSRLDTLYSAAIQEYKAGTLNRSELAQKYIQAGTMLEANVDSQFHNTLNAMQAELIANNLPTDIVGAIESEYEKAKSSKRSQLLAKVSK